MDILLFNNFSKNIGETFGLADLLLVKHKIIVEISEIETGLRKTDSSYLPFK